MCGERLCAEENTSFDFELLFCAHTFVMKNTKKCISHSFKAKGNRERSKKEIELPLVSLASVNRWWDVGLSGKEEDEDSEPDFSGKPTRRCSSEGHLIKQA